MPHLEALGARLYALRQDAELSRNGLAEAAEVSESTVERIERGTRRTRRPTLERITRVLDADAQELLDLAGPALAPESRYAERVARRRARRWRRKRNRGIRAGAVLLAAAAARRPLIASKYPRNALWSEEAAAQSWQAYP